MRRHGSKTVHRRRARGAAIALSATMAMSGALSAAAPPQAAPAPARQGGAAQPAQQPAPPAAGSTQPATRGRGQANPLPIIPGTPWRIHDMARPRPPVVTPGATVGAPPSDAIILFDGKDLSKWAGKGGTEPKWPIRDGYVESGGVGSITTRDRFGSIQLHLEFATPAEAKGNSQGRGNSGVIFMGLYEIQVLDSFNNDTYPDGQAAAIYGDWPPLANVARKPGEWQTYDIIFRRPHFDDGGKMIKRATFTVLHNGVLVQDHVEVMGVTTHVGPPYYEAHPDKLPLMLQDHGDLVRYRNVWIREL
jgi:hypothetical protein